MRRKMRFHLKFYFIQNLQRLDNFTEKFPANKVQLLNCLVCRFQQCLIQKSLNILQVFRNPFLVLLNLFIDFIKLICVRFVVNFINFYDFPIFLDELFRIEQFVFSEDSVLQSVVEPVQKKN